MRALDVRSIVHLADPAAEDPSLTGTKAARLAQLIRRGFPVLDGLVVTVAADESSANDLVRAMAAPDVDLIGPFAVRSSGVAEDGADASFAGQYLSLLDVPRGDLVDAVRRVRASAGDRRVSAYADGRHVDVDSPSTMAVLVQPMIAALRAGVAFTADPLTGDRRTVIVTGVRGLADALVSGASDGDEWQVRGGQASARRSDGTLDAGFAMTVAALATRVAQDAGSPQDIEWADDGRTVWLLQARPMSALPRLVSWAPPIRGAFGRNLRFGEWLYEPVTPLFESWLLTTMEQRLHAIHRQLVGQVAPRPHHVVINGWYFYRLDFLPVSLRSVMRSLPHMLPRLLRTPRRMAIIVPPTARFGARLYERDWREDLLPRYLRAVEDAEARVETADPKDLLAIIDVLAGLAGEYFASMTVVAGYAYKAELQLAGFCRRHLATALGGSHLVLLAGLAPPQPPPAHAVVSLDWWRPTLGQLDSEGYRDRPGDDARRSGRYAAQVEAREAAERRARTALSDSRRRRATFERLLAEAQRSGPIREEQVAVLTRPWPVMRRALARLGDAITARGSTAGPESIFFLTRQEVVAILQGEASSGLESQAASRRLAWTEAARLRPPALVGQVPRLFRKLLEEGRQLLGARSADQQTLVTGVPASGGRATGRVRVVLDPAFAESLQHGEILVAPLTAPAWTPLFDRCAAVVTDIGSPLSHASIIAREYGIPAVVGCGDATSRLHNGQLVTVDGGAGTVGPAETPQ